MPQDKRPCRGCERGAPFDGPYKGTAQQCRSCWLWHNQADYKAHWSGEPVPVPDNTVQYPSAVEMAANAAKATAEWIAAGMPQRTEEECKRIHLICVSCPSGVYDAAQDRCKACGCGLSRNASTAWIGRFGIPDAVKMASHHCPKKYW